MGIDDPTNSSLIGLVNWSSGVVAKNYEDYIVVWGATGNPVNADTGMAVGFRMGGQEYEQETGLYHLGARYYDPELHRFLSEDPAGIAGGLNLYEYARNDPMDAADPSGLHWCATTYDNRGQPTEIVCHWTQEDCLVHEQSFVQCGLEFFAQCCSDMGGVAYGLQCVTTTPASASGDRLDERGEQRRWRAADEPEPTGQWEGV